MEGKPKKRKGCLIVLIIFLALIAVIVLGVVVGVSSMEGQEGQSILAQEMDLTEQQEQDLLAIFDVCGILEVKEVSLFQAGESHTSYHVRDVETDSYKGMTGTIIVWLFNDTKAVEAIYFNDCDIYVDGEVVAQVPAYYISSAQRDEYRVNVQATVKKRLNYPDSAKFESASGWAYGVNDEGYDVIQSSVTAKNALGVEVTEQFQAKIDRATNTLVSLIIGSTEYVN